ncbi:hypothetical protein AKO1_005046, partial [Acrasis kona]
AGATSAALIVDDKIQARFTDGVASIVDDIPVANWTDGPLSIIQYVSHHKQTLVIDHAYQDKRDFVRLDPFVCENKVKSVLCIPVLYQSDLKAIVYLSNHLITNCFKPDSVVALNVISSQLAISMQQQMYFKVQLSSLEKIADMEKANAQEQTRNRIRQEEFIDRICHEIRNPIQGILGNCDALDDVLIMIKNKQEETEIIDSLTQLTTAIRACSNYQRTITDDVLTLSRLEHNKTNIEYEPVNPKYLLNSILVMFDQQASRKNLSFTYKIDFKNNTLQDVVVYADAARISTTLINLTTNAIKFTSMGGVSIACVVESSDECTDLSFSVSDTGCGIHKDHLPFLFDRFSQSKQRSHAAYSGSGLGLFISKMSVDLMGGQLCVNSVQDEGTVFYFTLKCRNASPMDHKQYWRDKNTLLSPVAHDSFVSQLKVMVVEDNAINQKVLVRMLSKQGCNCVVARDGLEAVEMYQAQRPFDLIVMDMSMPRMDGAEATRLIRAIQAEHGDCLFIIGLSGNARKEHRELAIGAGMDDYIHKPITLKGVVELVRRVRDCIENNK